MSDPLAPPPAPMVDWQRLDRRMLLVHPVTELVRFLPVLIGLFVASSATDRGGVGFQLLGVAVPIVIGLVRYWTTRYRISGDRIELERGLVSRHAVATPLDRVRTVDLTASPIHRLLGLSTVRIGTGSASEDGLDLDGLATPQARELRGRLLSSIAPPHAVLEDDAHPAGERVVARFEPGWLRYAPFTSAGLVLTAGVIGVGSQVLDGLGVFEGLDGAEIDRQVTELGALVALPAVLVGVLVVGAVVSVLGYLVANGNFALSHTLPDGSWHLRRGLLTTRETSVDDDRLRGVSIGEPIGLRLAGGARLSAIVTGLDRSQSGSEALLPPTPRALVDRVAADVLDTSVPVVAPLGNHGPRARTRRYTRALVPGGVVAVALAVGGLLVDAPVWLWLTVSLVVLVTMAGVGHDRARALGHTLVDGWLVARSGSLTRRRELLGTDAVIGWNLRSTWFQRRAGLVDLVATTAGGRQWVRAIDVPAGDAAAVAAAAVPGLVSQFLTDEAPRGS